MNRKAVKIISFIINLFEGIAGIIAFAIIYAFMFEADNPDHDVGLGVFVLILALIMILTPNLIFYLKGRFSFKEVLKYQALPFAIGGIFYLIYQIYLF